MSLILKKNTDMCSMKRIGIKSKQDQITPINYKVAIYLKTILELYVL